MKLSFCGGVKAQLSLTAWFHDTQSSGGKKIDAPKWRGFTKQSDADVFDAGTEMSGLSRNVRPNVNEEDKYIYDAMCKGGTI